MSKRNRYFIDREGPYVQTVRRLLDERRAAFVTLRAFMKEVGASQMYGHDAASYVFDFPHSSDADPKVWGKTKPRRGEYYFRPRRNTPEGKAMAARIKALPNSPDIDDAIDKVPGLHRLPIVVEGNRWFAPQLRFMPADRSFAVLMVPWHDYPEDELAKYRKDREAGKRYCASLDFAMWQPPEWLTEIKEWEALKLIEESSAPKAA